uniref:THAP-type domain-containing protein n=1 Tax=Sinocyclocheilus grahami TaxID=75366 RepID=A0A672JYG5_SINGR
MGSKQREFVPLCSVSSRYNSCASFHSFPVKDEIRKKCIVNIRRINFQITKHTKVCSVHFKPDDFVEGTSRRRLKKGAVPSVFEWNRERQMQPPRLSVWERREQPPLPESDMEEIEDLRKQLEQAMVNSRFGLQRFAGSDEDIRFYTRMIRVTSSKVTRETGLYVKTRALPKINEFFLFMMHLSLGLKQKDLAHCFHVHQTTVSCIITTWVNFLLGSVQIWLPKERVREYLPEEFKNFRDTQVILDCTELRCQMPSSLLLQSEVFSNYKSHCTFKALIGMAPHGAVTFVSGLYAGSISDRELFKQSGIIDVLTPDMAIMVDKGFLIDNLVPCTIHRPAFVTKGTQMSAGELRHTQSVARLRVHVERLIWRVKEHKLFDACHVFSLTEWTTCQGMGPVSLHSVILVCVLSLLKSSFGTLKCCKYTVVNMVWKLSNFLTMIA